MELITHARRSREISTGTVTASTEFIEQLWYGEHKLSTALVPISWMYRCVIALRKLAYGSGLIPLKRFNVPVIVIGNITAGGTGKTPLTIWLAKYLKDKGLKPGIVSRGYGVPNRRPQQVRPDSDPFLVGDEPVLIARQTHCPVAIGVNRVRAAAELLEHYDINVIISDDGLQHLPLYRDIEIAVVDGDRRFGNGHCLPAGPLREPVSSLEHVDMVVANNRTAKGEHLMEYETGGRLLSVKDPDRGIELGELRGQTVHAVAGIGNPGRFVSRLRREGLQVIKHVFPDHHPYRHGDIEFGDDLPVVMTEKDAVKCERFATERCWYLPVRAKLADTFIYRLDKCLAEINCG